MKKRKSEHRHGILHIRISVCTKLQLETDSFDFCDQICPKRMFPVENEKSEQYH